MELKIYDKQGLVKMKVSPDNSSQWNHEVGVENVVTVNFTTWEFLVLEVGWYILVEGQRFSIKSEYRPKHIHDTKYTYNLKFYGREHDAQDILFCRLNQGEDDLESVFAYDGTPMDFLVKVVANMNRNSDGVVWKAGEAITANRQTINFNGLYCWDALGEITRTFGTEWWMDGEYLNISKCERGESVSLGYGQGLKSGLTQNENTNAVKWFTRLIPVGSSKNIDKNKYGYATLQLPGREKYIDINTQYGLKEYREEAAFSEIYPHRVGTISSVRSEERTNEETGNYNVYYVKDSLLPFNPDDYMIGGEVIHMSFNTGALAGKEFEVNWNNDTKEFEIINQYPDENTQLPGGNLVPSADDTYVLWNISMPDEYIRAAEQELKTAVDVYLAEYSKDISVYSGSTDYIYISKNDVPLLLGQRVQLLSEIYFGNIGRNSRITRVSRKLNNLNEATIDCSDAIASSWKSSVDSSLNQLQFSVSKELAQTVIDILKTGDSGIPSDYNVLSALRSLQTFLRKDKDDRSVGGISTDKGFEAGRFVSGFLGGTGAWIGADGHGEMTSLTLRGSLRVPDYIFNRVDVVSGELWNAPAFGTLEDVDTENMIASVRLESNERCGLHVGDFCRGIFADFGEGNNWEGEDECGFMHLYGFWTSYFTPTVILDNEKGLFRFKYELKPDTTQHPTKNMKFAVYGNPNEKSRQASAYATRTYKRYLNNVTTWVIDPDSHIYAQYGDLNGLQIDGVTMHGYGSFQSNAYFRGVQIQLPPEQMESLKGDSAYAAQLTSYVGTVKLNADGNMSGGMFEELNVIADGKNVICRDIEQPQTFRNVTTKNYRLTTTVQAYKGTTPLYYSADVPVKGSFTLALACVGCTASVVNGAIIINSITDTKDCRINVTVNCEGMVVYNLEYNVAFVQDGKIGADGKKGADAVSYRIEPNIQTVSKTMTGTLSPESVKFKLQANKGGVIKYYPTVWSLKGRNIPTAEWTTLKSADGETSFDVVFTANYKYYALSAKTYGEGDVMLGDTLNISIVADGKIGADGKKGADAVSYRIEPNIQTVSKTMTGTLSPESVKFKLQANKGGVIKYYPTVWSLKGRNIPTAEWTTLKSADGETSFDVVFTANYKYYALSAKTYGEGDVMLGDTLNISIVADGKNGESIKGDKGAMPRYRGEFVFDNESEPYVYDGEYRDIVIYEGNVYQVYMYGSSIIEPPSIAANADNDGKWQRANKFRFVAMDTALIDSANIGGFMFKRTKYIDNVPVGRLESQYGPVVIREVSEDSGDVVPVTIRVTSVNGTTTLTSRIVKTKGDYAYSLKPTTRLVTLDKDDNPSVSSVSCSLIRKSVSGESSITSVPTGYTLKYTVTGGTEAIYTPNTSITVPRTNGATIVFVLRDNQSNIVSEEIVYVFSEENTQSTILYDRYIQFACNDDGSVKFGLPYRFRVSQWQGGKEVPLTNITLSGSYVTIDNERIELNAETGTLKCTNVDLTGVINAVGGVFRDISTPDGEFHVDGDGTTWIGGFRIKNNGLTNIDKNNESKSDAYILFSNTSENRKVSLGGNVLVPSTGVAALGQLESKKSNSLPNYALLFDVVNSSSGNFAFCGNGSGVLSNMVCGYGVQLINGSANTITRIERSIVKGNKFWVKSQSNTGIGLPPISAVREALDITDTSVNFSIPITIMNRGSYDIRVWGKNTDLSSMNNSNYPILDGKWWIKAGHSMDVVLGYCNGEYVAFIPVAYN